MPVIPKLYLYSQQEAVEGLVLFNMFITNLEKEIHNETSEFLNNTKLFRSSETDLDLWVTCDCPKIATSGHILKRVYFTSQSPALTGAHPKLTGRCLVQL